MAISKRSHLFQTIILGYPAVSFRGCTNWKDPPSVTQPIEGTGVPRDLAVSRRWGAACADAIVHAGGRRMACLGPGSRLFRLRVLPSN